MNAGIGVELGVGEGLGLGEGEGDGDGVGVGNVTTVILAVLAEQVPAALQAFTLGR